MKGEENKFILPSNSKGFIIGFRAWRHYPPGDILSLVAITEWKPNEALKANCLVSKIGSKMNGINAYRVTRNIPKIVYIYHVSGFVALWGTVIEHKYGYRAQYAYPLTLDVEDLANIYNVKYLPRPTLEDFNHLQDTLGWRQSA